MSVKSDRPMRPGGCSWRKITSRLGPLRARHLAMRRSNVRTPRAIPDSRRQISSKMATARMPGAVPASARSRYPTPRQAGRDGGVHAASFSGMVAADRLRSEGGGGAEPGLRGSDGGNVARTGLHVQPRLAVGDVSARQAVIPRDEESDAAPNRSDRQTTSVPWGKRAAGG